jgi:hypothetical protein
LNPAFAKAQQSLFRSGRVVLGRGRSLRTAPIKWSA